MKPLEGRRLLTAVMLGLLLPMVLAAGPLAEKARVFDAQIAERHLFGGLVFDSRTGPDGRPIPAGGGDSTIWTGAYAASQVYRHRATGDAAALDRLEAVFRGFDILQRMSGVSGFIGRAYGPPEWFGPNRHIEPGVGSWSSLVFIADTSRDQYTGVFLAYALGAPLVRDAQLRQALRENAAAVGRHLREHDLALVTTFRGQQQTQFNLNPTYCYQDRINPHEWETVDDFPFNLVRVVIPFDQRLADAVSTFMPPPIRGGEAWRALLMLGTAARVASDSDLLSYVHDDLLGRRNLAVVASLTSQLIHDLELGGNGAAWRETAGGLAVSFAKLGGEIGTRVFDLPRPFLRMLAPPALLIARTSGETLGAGICRLFDRLRRPGAFQRLERIAPRAEAWAAWFEGFGLKKPATRMRHLADWSRAAAASNLDELFDAMRSYVGTNITMFALTGILESETDPGVLAAARDSMERCWLTVADEKNALYTFMRAAFVQGSIPPQFMQEAKQTLLAYPLERHIRRFDHRNDPGLRLLPWPDRFGRFGGLADHPFPIDQRAPDIFIWQDNPRDLVTGGDETVEAAPVDYLLAYWFGRAHGLLSPED